MLNAVPAGFCQRHLVLRLEWPRLARYSSRNPLAVDRSSSGIPPKVLREIVQAWRPSLFAGFMGALASQFWFLGFATATAASVRTLALVEVLFAQGISRFVFKQPTTAREGLGIVLIVAGVLLLIWAY